MARKGPRDIQRKIRERNKIMLIIIEGNNQTERLYFNKFKQRNSSVKIEIPGCKIVEPVKLMEYALNKKKEYAIDFNEGDTVWCVFDVDAKKTLEMQRAKQLADRTGIRMVLSNPSFELWFLLHTDYYSTRPFSSNEELLRELKSKFPTYKKTDDSIFNIILPYQQQAIDKAQRLVNYHLQCQTILCSRESNPLTQVYELVEYINEFIN